MVLSLSFVLALVGSAVGLIIGMVIYGDISEAIECPVGEIIGGGGGGGNITTTAPNTGTYGSDADGLYFEDNVQMDFQNTIHLHQNHMFLCLVQLLLYYLHPPHHQLSHQQDIQWLLRCRHKLPCQLSIQLLNQPKLGQMKG